MRYVESSYKLYEREEIYRIYITDFFKNFGRINVRYADLVSRKKTLAKKEESPDEIKNRIFAKLDAMSRG